MLRPLNYPGRHAGARRRRCSRPQRRRAGAGDQRAWAGCSWTRWTIPSRRSTRELDACPLGGGVDAIVVDIHAEATSEKMAMGHYLDGRVSAGGRHPHPCADRRPPDPDRRHRLPVPMPACAATMTASSAWRRKCRSPASPEDADRAADPAEGEATICGLFRRDRRPHRPGPPGRAGARRRPAGDPPGRRLAYRPNNAHGLRERVISPQSRHI